MNKSPATGLLRLCLARYLEVQMVMQAAVGVEGALALRAMCGRIEVGQNRKGRMTATAHQRVRIEAVRGPGTRGMVRKRVMTFAASIVHIATRQPDGEHVIRAMVVAAACLRVHVDTVNV